MRKIWQFFRINYRFFLLGLSLSLGSYFAGQYWLFPYLRSYHQENVSRGLIGNYTLTSLPPDIAGLISRGLTRIDRHGDVFPALADHWEVADKGRLYTFYLKHNLFWHDHHPFRARDIHYQFNNVETKVLGVDKIQFQLKTAFAPFLTVVSQPLFRKKTLGLGDYRIKKIVFRRGDIISLLQLEAVNRERKPKKITFRFYPTQDLLQNAFLLGEIQEAIGLYQIDFLEHWPHIKIIPQIAFNQKYVALFFNTGKAPFDNKRFRQALAYALHKPEGRSRALTPISPLSWAYNRNVKTYNYNFQHAQKMLAASKIKVLGHYTLLVDANLLTVAEGIKKDWQKLGIQLDIRVAQGNFWQKDFDIFLGYGLSTPDPDQYYFWHSHQPGNICHYHNVRIDNLLEKGRLTLVKEERRKIYRDFQRFLVEDVPAIFLFYPTSYSVRRQPAISLP